MAWVQAAIVLDVQAGRKTERAGHGTSYLYLTVSHVTRLGTRASRLRQEEGSMPVER